MFELKKINERDCKVVPRKSIYPFATMTAGDSFFIPDSDERCKSVASAARAYKSRHNKPLVAKRAVEKGVSGILVYVEGEYQAQDDYF